MSRSRQACFVLALATTTLLLGSGCIAARIAANIMHASVGNKVPAKYEGLTEKRVAIVCMSRSGSYGSTSAAEEINRHVVKYLRNHIELIEIIDQQEIDEWIDEHDWNEIDYRELGQGIGADVLIGVDINSFSLHEGKNLYKGRADVELAVYDLALEESLVYEDTPPEIVYPITAGFFTAEISEQEFKKQFVDFVAYRIARNFYPYELSEDFGRDPSSVGF